MSQKHGVTIEICSNCKSHQWCTRHKQGTYMSLAQQISKQITSKDQNIDVKIIPVDGNKIGSFQIYCQGKTIFSKLNLGYFPHVSAVTTRIINCMNDARNGVDLRKYDPGMISPIKSNLQYDKLISSPKNKANSPQRKVSKIVYHHQYKKQQPNKHQPTKIDQNKKQNKKQIQHQQTHKTNQEEKRLHKEETNKQKIKTEHKKDQIKTTQIKLQKKQDIKLVSQIKKPTQQHPQIKNKQDQKEKKIQTNQNQLKKYQAHHNQQKKIVQPINQQKKHEDSKLENKKQQITKNNQAHHQEQQNYQNQQFLELSNLQTKIVTENPSKVQNEHQKNAE